MEVDTQTAGVDAEIIARNVERLAKTVKRLKKGQLEQEDIDDLNISSAELEALIVNKSLLEAPIMIVALEDLPKEVVFEGKVMKIDWINSEDSVTVTVEDQGVNDAQAEATEPPAINEKRFGASHPLFTPEILQMILSKLDKDSVYRCRQVCRMWNGNAIDVISKHHHPRILLSTPYLESEKGRVLEKLKDFRVFRKLVDKSDNPEVMMRTLISSGKRLSTQDKKSFLKRYGFLLKSLQIDPCLDIQSSLMKFILVDCCPNLEELDLRHLLTPRYSDRVFNSLEKDLTLKLQRLSIESELESEFDMPFLMSIIKLCPNLKVLKTQGSNTILGKRVAQFLKLNPEISKKLEELWFTINIKQQRLMKEAVGIVKAFTALELSPKLTTLTIQSNAAFKNQGIPNLLTKLRRQLKTLSFMNDGSDEDEMDTEISWKTGLPKMTKLRVLKHMADSCYQYESIDFLGRLPKLETLTLGRNLNFDALKSGRVDDLFSERLDFKSHSQLKELILLGSLHYRNTPDAINDTLPELTKLFVGLNDARGICCGCRGQWFERVFQGFSQMKNLKVLYLDFGEFDLDEDKEVDYSKAFKMLSHLQNLQHLTFICGKEICCSNVGGSKFVAALKVLLSTSNLYSLRLINFKMWLSDSMALADWLKDWKGITRVEFLTMKKTNEDLGPFFYVQNLQL